MNAPAVNGNNGYGFRVISAVVARLVQSAD